MTALPSTAAQPPGAHAQSALGRMASHRVTYAIALAVALFVLRSSSYFADLIDPDEAHYLLVARSLWQGGIPYVDAVDKKPLLTYLFYLPAAALGFSVAPLKVIGFCWVYATSLLLGRTARLWTGRADVGVCAAFLYALVSSCNNLCISAELMMGLPAAGALFFFVRSFIAPRRLDALWMGLCIGAASLFRHQGGILLVALLPVVALPRAGKPGMRAPLHGLLVLGGFAAPWALSLAIYAGLGHVPEFIDWNLLRNVTYVQVGAGGAWGRFVRAFGLYVLLGAPVPWCWALREGLQRGDRLRLGLWLCLVLTWIPVAMGGRYWSQYFLQFSVPLSLLAAPAATRFWNQGDRRLSASRAALTFALLLPLAVYLGSGYFRIFSTRFPYPSQIPTDVTLARFIAAHSQPQDRVFIWGYEPPLYTLAGRMPGTRYITTAVHLGDIEPSHVNADFPVAQHLSSRDIEATLADLQRHRPALIVDTAPADIHDFRPFPLQVVPPLFAYVQAHYDLLPETPVGARIYRRRP